MVPSHLKRHLIAKALYSLCPVSHVDIFQSPDAISKRHSQIKEAVAKIALGKRLVLIDGVGYPAVGSVCGVSNAQVAHLLGAPIVLVSRPGIGNTIDAMNYMRDYCRYHECTVLGAIVNKVPMGAVHSDTRSTRHNTEPRSSHSYEKTVEYVNKYFTTIQPAFSIYGYLPLLVEEHKEETLDSSSSSSSNTKEAVSCMLRPAKTDLQFTDEEQVYLQHMLKLAEQHLDIQHLVNDLHSYYKSVAAST